MTHGVFMQALRDAMVFLTLIIGCPGMIYIGCQWKKRK